MPYAYLIWSLILLGIWGAIFAIRSRLRGKMLRMSLITAPLGLSEPLFVPDYWLPPTLFDLAERTGFDLESLLCRGGNQQFNLSRTCSRDHDTCCQ